MKNEVKSEAYKFTRETFITFSIVYGILKCFNCELPLLLLFIASILVGSIIEISSNYKVKNGLFIILSIFFSLVIILGVFFHQNIFIFIKNAFLWSYEYIFKEQSFSLLYCIFISCLLLLVLMKMISFIEKNKIVFFLLLLGLMAFMIISSFYNIQWNPITVGMSIFYFFDGIIQIYQVEILKRINYSSMFLLPFICITVLLSVCIPSNDEPIKWTFIKNTVYNVKDSMQGLVYYCIYGNNDEKYRFDVNRAGFSDEGGGFLGTLIDDKERNMFTVDVSDSVKTRYLYGITRSTYTRDGWQTDDEYVSEDEYKMELNEKLYNLYYSDLSNLQDEYFSRRVRYKISFNKLATNTVFRPENCISIDKYSDNADLKTIGDNIYFKNKHTKGYSYYASSLIMNMNNDEIKAYLERLNSKKNYYAKENKKEIDIEGSLFEQTAKELNFNDEKIKNIISDNFRKQLLERSKRIEEKYLQLPKDNSKKIKDLAEEITKGCTNQYDKAEAICNYLKENYKYSTKLDELPDGKDPVEYFLFEEKKGYCTYFASSMAILCRDVGIPTRYVEGAFINYRQKKDDAFVVKSGASHAWTEIYLEGFGWVRMDSTPGYGVDSISWRIINYSNRNENGYEVPVTEQTDSTQIISSLQSQPNNNVLVWIKYIIILVSIIVFLILCVLLLYKWNERRLYKKATNKEKAFICMKKIFSSLNKLGYPIIYGETIKEYLERLKSNENFEYDDIIDLLEWFQYVRYSNKSVAQEEVKKIENAASKKYRQKSKIEA